MPPQVGQTPPETTSTTLQAVDAMIGEVAALIGGADDSRTRERAQFALDRAADRMNMAGTFLFRRKENTFTSFTAAQATLALPSDWGWPEQPAYALDSGGDIIQRVEWKTWDLLRRRLADDSDTGVPEFLSILSELDSLIYVAPKIDTASVTSIRVPYFAKIQRISEATSIALSPEAREALITGGEFFAMRYRYAKFPQVWRPFQDDFYRAIAGARAAANRWLAQAFSTAVPEVFGSLSTGGDSNASLNPPNVFIRV